MPAEEARTFLYDLSPMNMHSKISVLERCPHFREDFVKEYKIFFKGCVGTLRIVPEMSKRRSSTVVTKVE
jgi:hypothetical protein